MNTEHTGEKRERKRLNDRWNKVVGGDIPEEIERLPIEKVRRAVELAESGQTPFVPKEIVRASADPAFGSESSMMEWDSHGLHT